MEGHTEKILCPECTRIQLATVEHTLPWPSYFHECECGYMILESEWNPVVEVGDVDGRQDTP